MTASTRSSGVSSSNQKRASSRAASLLGTTAIDHSRPRLSLIVPRRITSPSYSTCAPSAPSRGRATGKRVSVVPGAASVAGLASPLDDCDAAIGLALAAAKECRRVGGFQGASFDEVHTKPFMPDGREAPRRLSERRGIRCAVRSRRHRARWPGFNAAPQLLTRRAGERATTQEDLDALLHRSHYGS